MVTEQGNFNSQNVWFFGYHLIPAGKKNREGKMSMSGKYPVWWCQKDVLTSKNKKDLIQFDTCFFSKVGSKMF